MTDNQQKKTFSFFAVYSKLLLSTFYYPLRSKYHQRRKRKELDKIKKDLGIPNLPKRKIFIYPYNVKWSNPMWSILHLLNFKITQNPADDFDIALHWLDATFKEVNPILLKISERKTVVNLYSTDISKKRLDMTFKEVFGYNTEINPAEFVGKAVKKSNYNFQKNGEIIQCPVSEIEDDYIYQLFIDSQYDDNYFSEYRVPVFRNQIPFVYDKLVLIKERFWGVPKKVSIKEAEEIFSADEIDKIIELCQKMKVDCCELDIFRDKHTQKIYVVDLNDTVGGLQGQKNPDEGRSLYKAGEREEAILRLTRAFYESFCLNPNKVKINPHKLKESRSWKEWYETIKNEYSEV